VRVSANGVQTTTVSGVNYAAFIVFRNMTTQPVMLFGNPAPLVITVSPGGEYRIDVQSLFGFGSLGGNSSTLGAFELPYGISGCNDAAGQQAYTGQILFSISYTPY